MNIPLSPRPGNTRMRSQTDAGGWRLEIKLPRAWKKSLPGSRLYWPTDYTDYRAGVTRSKYSAAQTTTTVFLASLYGSSFRVRPIHYCHAQNITPRNLKTLCKSEHLEWNNFLCPKMVESVVLHSVTFLNIGEYFISMWYISLGRSENHVVTKFVLVTMETVQSNYDFSWGWDGRPLYNLSHCT